LAAGRDSEAGAGTTTGAGESDSGDGAAKGAWAAGWTMTATGTFGCAGMAAGCAI
jgi:hypothetical protein